MNNKKNQIDELLNQASELRWQIGNDYHDKLTEGIYADAASITQRAEIRKDNSASYNFDRMLDKVLTSRTFGFPIMGLILSIILWLTIQGANYPSSMLDTLLLGNLYPFLKDLSNQMGIIWWIDGLLLDGIYMAVAWVIAVMLPPMAIFFPLFTLLEDFGYLPRVAFNLDG